jgi:hypothetical protein
VITIRGDDDAVAALFGSCRVGVAEPETLHLCLIKEATLAPVVEEFAGVLVNPVAAEKNHRRVLEFVKPLQPGSAA